MYFLKSEFTKAAYNIALEEYLLRETDKEIFMLYVDEPSIVVGKHQNTMAEVNYRFVVENNIQVVRRISGGGTVFHDLGNLNFCFIANSREGQQIDFKKYTQPIIEVLRNEYQIDAVLAGKNDIRVNDLKVSGNAEHVFKNRVLHHGTLLVNSNLENLSAALRVVPEKYIDKAVKSIRSKVANLSTFNPSVSIPDLIEKLQQRIADSHALEIYPLTKAEHIVIQEKVKSKFNTWEWNYAYSPSYQLVTEKVELIVENGLITYSKYPENLQTESVLLQKPHRFEAIKGLIPNVWDFF